MYTNLIGATPEPDESHDVSEDEGDPLTDQPSLHRQREETQSKQKSYKALCKMELQLWGAPQS